MNDITNLSNFIQNQQSQLDLIPILFNFVICLLMAFIIRALYIRRSYSLTGEHHIASILPVLSAVVFSVIVVVKSSLALSLGLVGALSIVRFRTPIKEPEELVYLFMAISIGLGYGAGHTLITTCLTLLTLTVIFIWLSNRSIIETTEYNFVIHWSKTELTFENIVETVAKSVDSLKLVRLDYKTDNNTAVLILVPNAETNFDIITNTLKKEDSSLTASFYEAKTNW
ncbi:MAG: DUF4956 domain-containing protein [Flavobacteriales bacterium]|nr:DUF4956 domain-containing protein [Flavobacteriales bacterium]